MTMDDVVIDNQTITKHKVKKPKRYAVIFHNDDFTTMDFVVFVLMKMFHKSHEDASRIMINVHKNGHDIVDIYTKEIAEEKAADTIEVATANGFPLLATAEPYDDEN